MTANITNEHLDEFIAGISSAYSLKHAFPSFISLISEPRDISSAALRDKYDESIAELHDINAQKQAKSKTLFEHVWHLFGMYNFPESRFMSSIAPENLRALSSGLSQKAQSLRREHGRAMSELGRLRGVMTGEVNDLMEKANQEDQNALTAGHNAKGAGGDAAREEQNAADETQRAWNAQTNADNAQSRANELDRAVEKKKGGVLKTLGTAAIIVSTPLHGGAGLAVLGGGAAAVAAGMASGSSKSDLKDTRDYHRRQANDFRSQQTQHQNNANWHRNRAKNFRTQEIDYDNDRKEHERIARESREMAERVRDYIRSLDEINSTLRQLEPAFYAVMAIELDISQLTGNMSLNLRGHYTLMRSKSEVIRRSCEDFLGWPPSQRPHQESNQWSYQESSQETSNQRSNYQSSDPSYRNPYRNRS